MAVLRALTVIARTALPTVRRPAWVLGWTDRDNQSVIGILELGPGDWRLWRQLRLAALAEAPAAFCSTLSDWTGPGDTEARWRDRLSSVGLNVVLTWDGDPAAMVSATAPDPDGVVELISMWVSPVARGHGLGDAAVRHVLAWAAISQHAHAVVLSVKAHNDAAIALYRRQGLVDAGPRPDDPDQRLMLRET